MEIVVIPGFDRRGNQPSGQHSARWEEVADRFGQPARRRELLAGLRRAIDLLAIVGCRRVWLDGSFVSDVEAILGRAPRDVDVCWDATGVEIATLRTIAPGLDPIRPDRSWQRHFLGGDYFAVVEPIDLDAPGLLAFFSHDRDGYAKGLIVLDLVAVTELQNDR